MRIRFAQGGIQNTADIGGGPNGYWTSLFCGGATGVNEDEGGGAAQSRLPEAASKARMSPSVPLIANTLPTS